MFYALNMKLKKLRLLKMSYVNDAYYKELRKLEEQQRAELREELKVFIDTTSLANLRLLKFAKDKRDEIPNLILTVQSILNFKVRQ